MKALLLGAGSSYECGMPLLWEFTVVLRRNVLSRLKSHLFDFRKQPEFQAYFESLMSNPTLHYEQIVGELEAIHIGRGPKSLIAFNTARQLIDCIQILLLEDQLKTTALLAEKVKDYSGLKSLLSVQPWVDVFSLNHDVNVEEICKFHGIPCRDGFFETIAERYAHIAQFKTLTQAQLDARSLNFFGPEAAGVNLIKLHGSLDIFAAEDKGLYLKAAPPASAPVGGHAAEVLRVEAHSRDVCANLQMRGIGELFATDVNGGLQFLRRSLLSGAHKFQGRFEQIAPVAFLNEFQSRLAMATQLDVIGYGFGDSHINDSLVEWLGNPRASIAIYDPKRSQVPPELACAVDRITIHRFGFTEYCHRLGRSVGSGLSHDRRVLLEHARERLRRKRLRA